MESAIKLDHGLAFAAYHKGSGVLLDLFRELRVFGYRAEVVLNDPEGLLEVNELDLSWLTGLYPDPARSSILGVLEGVRCWPPMWMAKASLESTQTQVTNDVALALSPTAATLGHVSWRLAGEELRATVDLCSLAQVDISPEVRWIVQARAYVHELAHTLLTIEWRMRQRGLVVDGHVTPAWQYLHRLAQSGLTYGPISRYASAYRDSRERYIRYDDDPEAFELAAEEELADQVTAWLIGFTVSPKGLLVIDPFSDRADVSSAWQTYLTAPRAAYTP